MATVRQWKKKLKKKVKIDEEILHGFKVKIFSEYPGVLRLTQEDEGKRIWLAEESQMYAKKIYLVSCEEDVLEITYQGEKKYRSVYKAEAILHPEEFTEERLERFGHKVKDGRKNA